MKPKITFSIFFLFFFLFLARGGWLPTIFRLDTGDPPGLSSSEHPQISISGSNVYVAWADDRIGGFLLNDIYFNYSTDGGATSQTSDILLDVGDPPGESLSGGVQICSSNGNVYAAW
jgi:hypothetical protein